jgi:hypothetical protein
MPNQKPLVKNTVPVEKFSGKGGWKFALTYVALT